MLHMRKVAGGYDIVDVQAGPYSHSTPVETVVFSFSDADEETFSKDLQEQHQVAQSAAPQDPAAVNQPLDPQDPPPVAHDAPQTGGQ